MTRVRGRRKPFPPPNSGVLAEGCPVDEAVLETLDEAECLRLIAPNHWGGTRPGPPPTPPRERSVPRPVPPGAARQQPGRTSVCV